MTETQPALAERLATRFGDKLARVQSALGEVTIEVAAEHLLEDARALRDEPDHLADVGAAWSEPEAPVV